AKSEMSPDPCLGSASLLLLRFHGAGSMAATKSRTLQYCLRWSAFRLRERGARAPTARGVPARHPPKYPPRHPHPRNAAPGLGALLGSALLAACTSVPAAGPSPQSIATAGNDPQAAPYALIGLNPATVERIGARKQPSFRKMAAARPSSSVMIGVGDV